VNLLLNLLLAHLFADFPLQTDALARYKHKHLMGVLLHVLIYTFVTAIMIAEWTKYWPLVVGLGTLHFVIDAMKPYLYKQFDESIKFGIDQFLHLVSMIFGTVMAHWWWDPTPLGSVPSEWLPYALFAALLPAFIVAYWIWANDTGYKYRRRYQWLNSFYRRALMIEQRFGLAVMGLTIWFLVRSGS